MISVIKAQIHYWRWLYYDWRYGQMISRASRLICPVCKTDILIEQAAQAGVVGVIPCWRCWL